MVRKVFSTRRVALTTLMTVSAVSLFGVLSQELLTPTPSTGPGPFYPVNDSLDMDNDLTQVKRGQGVAKGTILYIDGEIKNQRGQPIPGVKIVIWQVDPGGNYNHPDEPGSIKQPGDGKIDPNFQYWGKAVTDQNGRYAFKTIVPGHYYALGVQRPNHVHFLFRHPDYRALATELNFAGDPNFEHDFVTERFTSEQLALLNVQLVDAGPNREKGAKAARFDIVLRSK